MAPLPQRAPLDTFRYEITPAAVATDSATRDIEVRLSFRIGPSGHARVVLPYEWAGHRDLYRSITDLSSESPSVRLEATAQPYMWTVRAARAGTVTIRYRVHQDWSGSIRRPEYHRAIAGRDLALLVGQNALVVPERDLAGTVVVRVAWRDLPAGWRAASSFGAGPVISATTTIADLRDALFVAGLAVWKDSIAGGRRLVLGSVGPSAIPDSAFARMTADLLERERRFWADPGPPAFLAVRVTIASGLGGSAFTNAVAMFADSASNVPAFGRTLAHELFHLWNGRRLRLAGPEGSGKWFTEGITDFYADRISEAAGILSRGEYVARANRAIRDYYLSPVRNTPRDSVGRTYWTDQDMNRLPYLQGYLLAAHLDRVARVASNGRVTLDSILARLLKIAPKGGEVTTQDVIAAFPAAARAPATRAVASFVDRGETIPVDGDGFGSCIAVTQTSQFGYDLGFDAASSTRDRKVFGVRPGAAAHRAGLRDGMPLTAWGWYNGEPDSTVRLRVTDSSGVGRAIEYFPRSAAPVAVPRLSAVPCRSS